MAIIRLTDIVTTMKDKWTYGDKFFGYTEEFNDNHNTQYPSLLITPPDSAYPELSPKNGWEDYAFEVYFSDLYNRTDQANESIEQRWDNLQDLANEWLDMFLKTYMGAGSYTYNQGANSYLTDGSLIIERRKEVANDQLLQLKMNFSWRVFSKCFTPVSTYPNQISGLSSWLRADSNVTFSIPTKKVSSVVDGSGNTNGVAQTAKSLQPLRYTYGGGALDKTRISFNGTSDYLVSDNNCPITGNDFAIFYVGKVNALTVGTQRAVGYRDASGGGSDRLNFGVASNGRLYFKAKDDTGNNGQITSTAIDQGTNWHIGYAAIEGTDFYLQYNDSPEVTINIPLYSNNNGFNLAPFRVGFIESGIAGDYWDGDIQEVIIYNKFLPKTEQNKIRDYLNKKYNIY